MATAFPNSSQSPWTNPDNGKEYEYVNGVWTQVGGSSSGGGGSSNNILTDIIFYKFKEARDENDALTGGYMDNNGTYFWPDLNGRDLPSNYDVESGSVYQDHLCLITDASLNVISKILTHGSLRQMKNTSQWFNELTADRYLFIAYNASNNLSYLDNNTLKDFILKSEQLPLNP